MSSSTRRACSALVFALACAACEGPSATVVVRPSAASGADLGGLTALKVVVRNTESERPDVFGPFALDGAEHRLPATVPADTPFYVDVWGCADGEECPPEDLVARGCTLGLQTLEEGRVGILNLDLFSRDQPEFAVCPPKIR